MNNTHEMTSKRNTRAISTKYLVLTGMFTAIICVMAQLEIPIQPIPFTLSLFAIFLTGALLPPRYALMSVLAYILLGAFGLPVFAGLKGGIHILVGVTGGYIMAYPILAFLPSLFYSVFKKGKVIALTIGMLLSLFLCYLIGTLWFMHVTGNNMYSALTLCVFPYIPFDLVKIVLAVSLSTILRKTALKALLAERY
jgi:biotin transport system substrate-specific component